MNALYKARATTTAGRQIEVALELDNAITNYSVPWDDITAENDTCLRILREERNKHQIEETERQKR